MQKYLFIILLFIYSSLIASSKINDLNVYIYPEYYYSGVMVEINGKINLPDSSFSMKMLSLSPKGFEFSELLSSIIVWLY